MGSTRVTFGSPTRGGYAVDFLSGLSPAEVNLIFLEVFNASSWAIQMFYGRTGRVATTEGRVQFLQTILANPTEEQDLAAAIGIGKTAMSRGQLGRENENYYQPPVYQDQVPAPQTDEDEEAEGSPGLEFGSIPALAPLSFTSSPSQAALSVRDSFGGINAQHSALNALTVSLSETGAFSVNADGTITNVFGQVVGKSSASGVASPTTNPPAVISEPTDPGPGVGSQQSS